MVQRVPVLAVIGLASVVVTGTRGSFAAPGDSPKTRARVVPAKSDTLLIHYGDDPDTINAVTGSDTTSDTFQRWVYQNLADIKFENSDVLEPVLAEK
jgi:hypothetical protein